MARTITISGSDYARLAQFGLDDLPEPETMEFRNERPSGYGDDEGEWFATIESHHVRRFPYASTYHVLITGTHGNDHSPGASHYTTFELFDADVPSQVEAFRDAVSEWENKPETDPDYEPETDDESELDEEDRLDRERDEESDEEGDNWDV